MNYRCPSCGAESRRGGECDMCAVEMEKVCDSCGEAQSQCLCGGEAEEGTSE